MPPRIRFNPVPPGKVGQFPRLYIDDSRFGSSGSVFLMCVHGDGSYEVVSRLDDRDDLPDIQGDSQNGRIC